MDNTDPNNTKAGKEIREPVSPSQLGGRHSNPIVTTPMIALDFSGTTHLSANHNVAFNQNLTPVILLNKVLAANTKLRMAGNPYLEAETSGRTIGFHCTKKTTTSRSSPRSFYSLRWVTIGRATHKESSATKIAQNNGGERRQSTEKSHAFTVNGINSNNHTLHFSSHHQNDAASHQQLIPNPFQNNQQLVTINNSNDDVRDTSHSLPTAGHKALHSKRCVSTYQNDVASPSAAGHSNQQLVARLNQFLTNATADSATLSAVNTKKLTNTCRFLVNPRTRASAASRYLFKRYY
ncbi:hypothetical protein F511_19511 [Dorcoceras hygrometricum]|uniref:Uncharacterized protein n=1 Tax=Dorcoceras hygrometricum TaxID=472368 RepID=A0A2Z7BXZ9_9LAMI|nr:hypothetical protein F511_19511 [Dorcoceras hygrometricum]